MQILGNVVFQSTLPRRERLQQADILEMMSKFQSTLPRRERLKFVHRVQNFPHFNPRSREGSDVHRIVDFIEVCLFQSTLPRRERHGIKTITDAFAEFQSTLPRRERLLPEHRLHRLLQISIHAPAKGATVKPFIKVKKLKNFNPRSREGSDPKAGANQDQR